MRSRRRRRRRIGGGGEGGEDKRGEGTSKKGREKRHEMCRKEIDSENNNRRIPDQKNSIQIKTSPAIS